MEGVGHGAKDEYNKLTKEIEREMRGKRNTSIKKEVALDIEERLLITLLLLCKGIVLLAGASPLRHNCSAGLCMAISGHEKAVFSSDPLYQKQRT